MLYKYPGGKNDQKVLAFEISNNGIYCEETWDLNENAPV